MPHIANRTRHAGALAELPGEIAEFALPTPSGAEDQFQGLQTQALGGLQGLIGTSPAPSRQGIEEALFGRTKEAIERQAGDVGRDIKEGTFGRGVGLSTITGDLLDRLNRERLDAIERARREAFLGAGAEQRAESQARLAPINTAFGAGFTQTGREQQARQFGLQQGFQNLLNRLEREQRGTLQRESFRSAEDIASNQLLAGGIVGGLGGLASIFSGWGKK